MPPDYRTYNYYVGFGIGIASLLMIYQFPCGFLQKREGTRNIYVKHVCNLR